MPSSEDTERLNAARREDILSGPLVRALLRLAWPTAAASALQGVLAAVDVIMVGRLGGNAVAAVTAARQAVMIQMVAGNAFAIGGGALVAQAIGRGDRDEANHVLTQALLSFCVLLVAVLIPAGWWLTPPAMRWLTNGDAEVVRLGVPYMRVIIVGSIFTLLGFGAAAGLRGAGDTQTPLRVALVANVLHVPANYLFIFGLPSLGLPGLGVVGAAWGTMAARSWTNLLLFWWLYRGGLVLRLLPPSRWRFDPRVMWSMGRIGLPASLSSIILNLNGVAVLSVLARTEAGSVALAAFGLSSNLRNLGTWITWGLSDATMAMVGQNIGARQRRRARAAGFAAARVAFAFLAVAGTLMALVGPWVFPLVLREDDPARKQLVVTIAMQFMLTQVVALPCLGVGMTIEGALRGAGDAMAAMLNNALSFLVVGVPLCFLLALKQTSLGPLTIPGAGLGPWGVWIGMSLAMMTRGASMYQRWRVTRWRAQPVDADERQEPA